ncbi:PepSY-associated TM helix domain-containing protein [Pseudoalteromonas rhizosphaerae]|uniref:PepSY-associated TM helix domain-containing protein n=1 Tax=Pseudoalteromonas rhizosphaerae TaxID=2518973 RepID=UPI003850BA6E
MRVRADILRTYQGVHTWTGIIAGLVLFIGFYAGSLTMFKYELADWSKPVSAPVLTPHAHNYQALIDQAIAHYPAQMSHGFSLDLLTDKAPLSWYSQGTARGMKLDNQLQTLYLNAQNELVIQQQSEHKLADLIDYLHRTAGFAGEIGHDQSGVYILGVAAILYFLALVSGVIILLPTLVKTFFALRKEKGASRVWLDSHNLVGIVSLPFHFIIAFTVVIFAFHDLIYGGLTQFYGDEPLFQRGTPAAQSYHIDKLPSLEKQLLAAKNYAPGYEPIHISFSRLNSAMPSAVLKMSNNAAVVRGPDTDYLFLNPYTLEVVNSSYPQGEDSQWGNFVASLFSLHFGTYGGEWGRWGYFMMGLFGALLFYSGNLLWVDKRLKKAPNKRSTRFMAHLTIGVCFGSMLGVAVTLLVAKWSNLYIENANYSYLYSYYLVFFSFVTYTFVKGTQPASFWGLIGLVVLCASMGLSTLIHAVLTEDYFKYYSSTGVDISAAVLAIIFYLSAKKVNNKSTSYSMISTS